MESMPPDGRRVCMTPFDEAIALTPQADGRWLGHTHPGWANQVGPFGGIIAAQAMNAVLVQPDRLGDPVALTVNYCAPLADGPYVARVRAARTNRSTQHWIVELEQNGQAVITATALTAVRRPTWGDDEQRMPAVPRPAEVALTSRPATVPWLERYEMRFVEGEVPTHWDGSEHPASLTRLWVRDRPARALDAASLAAFADIFFPRIWLRKALRVPIGTVTMTVYFHGDAARLAEAGEGYVLGQARGQGFCGGYFDHAGQLWSEGGALLATTQQVVYYK
jgi:acyl-CoA thioesterase